MPLIKNYEYQSMPQWSALKMYRKYCFHQDETVEIQEEGYKRLAFIVLMGTVQVTEDGRTETVHQYEVYQAQSGKFQVKGIFEPPFYFVRNCDILLIGGDWKGADINLFMVNNSDMPGNGSPVGAGTPCDYYRNTNFDNHYHDFDEFWIICEGSGVVQDNGRFYEVSEGDCVATGAGFHHDFPIAHSFVRALAIEISPEGDQRRGHLCEQLHGKASGDPSKA